MATEDANSSGSIVPKSESILDDFTTSSASSPTAEPEDSTSIGLGAIEPPPVQKRKGGRKPIYATSEERKQRNRQAQAAFRERRTEYIKQLETTIQHHEETLHNLQQSHRTAADECLMLRYKNSLLERILLEKGIDVQAELKLKSSPHLRPVHSAPLRGQNLAMQKTLLSRQQQVRQRPSLTSPTQTQTPTSQQSSPSALRSPGFSVQRGVTSPAVDLQNQQQQHLQRPATQVSHHHYTEQSRPHLRPSPAASAAATSQQYGQVSRPQNLAAMQAAYYPSSFQKHYDQLDQEYDAQKSILDNTDADDIETDNFVPNFRLPPSGATIPMGMQASPPATVSAMSESGGNSQALPFDYDPLLDADPFGLTASMHFPNSFQFPPTHVGRR